MFYFCENIFYRNGFLLSSEFWNDAEGTFVVASFSDFEIFKFVCCIRISSEEIVRLMEIGRNFVVGKNW